MGETEARSSTVTVCQGCARSNTHCLSHAAQLSAPPALAMSSLCAGRGILKPFERRTADPCGLVFTAPISLASGPAKLSQLGCHSTGSHSLCSLKGVLPGQDLQCWLQGGRSQLHLPCPRQAMQPAPSLPDAAKQTAPGVPAQAKQPSLPLFKGWRNNRIPWYPVTERGKRPGPLLPPCPDPLLSEPAGNRSQLGPRAHLAGQRTGADPSARINTSARDWQSCPTMQGRGQQTEHACPPMSLPACSWPLEAAPLQPSLHAGDKTQESHCSGIPSLPLALLASQVEGHSSLGGGGHHPPAHLWQQAGLPAPAHAPAWVWLGRSGQRGGGAPVQGHLLPWAHPCRMVSPLPPTPAPAAASLAAPRSRAGPDAPMAQSRFALARIQAKRRRNKEGGNKTEQSRAERREGAGRRASPPANVPASPSSTWFLVLCGAREIPF